MSTINESLNLKVVNISIKNGIMPKEFYWRELQVDRLNETFENAKPYQTHNFQMFAPKMPLNTSPLCVALHVKNLSDTERELKMFKQLLCDCSTKKNRLRKEGRKPICEHKRVVELRPTFERIKPDKTLDLELKFRYELLGQQEVHFMVLSSCFTIKLQISVTTIEFDPSSMLLTKYLAPIAINLHPAPQQNLWLYNPYTTDIRLRLISGSDALNLANDEIVVQSHQHSPVFLTFTPRYVGSFELEIKIVFNECKSSVKIYGECTGREQDLLHFSSRNNSPNYNLNSQLNPFVLHGDNLCIELPQHGVFKENLIGLQNNSKVCIKFEWHDLQISAFAVEICVEPKSGYLKPGFTKLFRVTAKSLGCRMIFQMIPIKCSISKYHKENLREYSLPDGYFEYTEKGYYEKPLNWSPNCLEFLQCVYLNVKIRVLNASETIKYATMSEVNQTGEHIMVDSFMQNRHQRLNIIPSIVCDGDVNFPQARCEMSDDEQRMIETLISLILNGLKYERKQKLFMHEDSYATLIVNKHKIPPNDNNAEEKKSLIPQLMNDVLFDCLADISKEHRFIPPSW